MGGGGQAGRKRTGWQGVNGWMGRKRVWMAGWAEGRKGRGEWGGRASLGGRVRRGGRGDGCVLARGGWVGCVGAGVGESGGWGREFNFRRMRG
eukprot:14097-Pleurochrysis_carterae.AAC.1